MRWHVPAAWTTRVLATVQNAAGETMTSFGNAAGESLAGYPLDEHEVHGFSDLVTTVGWRGGMAITSAWSLKVGADAAFGPNASGSDTQTVITGAHLLLGWGGANHGRPGRGAVSLLVEFLARDYEVDDYVDDPDGTPASGDETGYLQDTLHDYGLVTQLEVGVSDHWMIGMRYEQATGSGESVGGRNNDPLRDDRWRWSPMIAWQPLSELRLRLQYNLDQASHLDSGTAHTIWLGLEAVLGHHRHDDE